MILCLRLASSGGRGPFRICPFGQVPSCHDQCPAGEQVRWWLLLLPWSHINLIWMQSSHCLLSHKQKIPDLEIWHSFASSKKNHVYSLKVLNSSVSTNQSQIFGGVCTAEVKKVSWCVYRINGFRYNDIFHSELISAKHCAHKPKQTDIVCDMYSFCVL